MREEHLGAIFAAKEVAGDVQAIGAAQRDRAENLVGMVAQATGGENCNSEAGRRAYEIAARVPELIDGVFAALAEVVNELDLYANDI